MTPPEIIWLRNYLDERIHTQHHGVEPILSDGSTLSILAGIALGPSDLALEVIDRHHETPSSIFSIRAQGSQ